MTNQKIKKELTEMFQDKGVMINCIKIWGSDKENKSIKKITVSLESYESDTLFNIKDVLDMFTERFSISIDTSLIEI